MKKYIDVDKLYSLLPSPNVIKEEDENYKYDEGYNDCLMEIVGIIRAIDQVEFRQLTTIEGLGECKECNCKDFILRTVYYDEPFRVDEIYECKKCHAYYCRTIRIVDNTLDFAFDRYFVG